jgi:hypothetical protein
VDRSSDTFQSANDDHSSKAVATVEIARALAEYHQWQYVNNFDHEPLGNGTAASPDMSDLTATILSDDPRGDLARRVSEEEEGAAAPPGPDHEADPIPMAAAAESAAGLDDDAAARAPEHRGGKGDVDLFDASDRFDDDEDDSAGAAAAAMDAFLGVLGLVLDDPTTTPSPRCDDPSCHMIMFCCCRGRQV